MTRLSGGSSAARLAHAVLLQLHGARPGDLEDADFPAPEGRVPVELCVFGGKRSDGACGQTLTEWVRADEVPPLEAHVVAEAGNAMKTAIHAAAIAAARCDESMHPS